MKRGVLAVLLSGLMVLTLPGTAWSYDRNFDTFRISPLDAEFMRVVIALSLIAEQNPPDDCRAHVPVNLQRRRNGRWRTVKSFETNDEGKVRSRMRRRRGRFRAVAPEFMTEAGNQCYESTSPTRNVE